MAMDFASNLKSLLSKLDNYQEDNEPLEELSELLRLTAELLETPSSLAPESMGQLVQVLPNLVASILSNRKFKSAEAVTRAGAILGKVILLLPSQYTSPRFLEAFRLTVELEKPFYHLYDQDDRGYSVAILPEDPVEEEENSWRGELAVNSKLDAVKIDFEYDRKCWARAEVVAVEPGDLLALQFEDEGSEFDRKVHRGSPELAQLNNKSTGDEWRSSLDKDSLIDVYDSANTWYNSTVLASRSLPNEYGSTTHEVYVGYRVYEPEGEKHDEHGSYRGWSSRYDEWLSVRSPRIAQYNQHARLWPIPTVAANEEAIIDDSNDLIETRPGVYCVTRTKKNRSRVLIRNLNAFGRAGLFDVILRLLEDRENWASFELAYSLAHFVGRCYALYHKSFACSFAPVFQKTLCSYFLESPVALMREFQRERVDAIKSGLEGLLKRYLTIPEKNVLLEQFSLELSLLFFNTPYLERRIHGLRGLSEAVKAVRFASQKAQRTGELVQCMSTHSVVEQIFGPKGHFQLIQRSSDVLRLLASEGALTVAHLDVIWSSVQTDDEDTKQAVYKVLGEVSTNLNTEQIEALVTKIAEISPATLRREEVELLYELTRYPLRAGSASSKACEFLFGVAVGNRGYAPAVVAIALEHFTDLMKSWDLRKNRLNVMVHCIEKLRENQAALQCIQITRKLLANFGMHSTSTDYYSQPTVIGILVKDHDALTAFFDNLRHFKTMSTEAAERLESRELIQDVVVCDQGTYKEQIEERLAFLLVMLTGSYSLTLSQGQMDALWELLMQQCLCRAEKEAYLRWLAEVTDQQSQGKKIFNEDSIHRFFAEKIANPESDFSDLSTEGFTVFKSYFLLVNIALHKVKQTFKTQAAAEPPREFDYKILVPPYELEGFACLRKIVMQVALEAVHVLASSFLNDVYEHLATAESLIHIREEYIQYCLQHLQTENTLQKQRSLSLLKTFMEECDKEGTGGLVSHSALLQGDVHTLTIHNQIFYQPHNSEIPKRIELKVRSNTTLWELRSLIGQKVRCLNDQFRIYRAISQKELVDRENGKTLRELRLRLNESFNVYRRTPNVTKVSLLTPDDQMVPQLKKIFSSWFFKYADKRDKMSPEGCAAFTNSCTGDPCKSGDRRIQEFFVNYDDDNDGLLTEENFLEFYRQATLFKIQTVWGNLASHHYRNDLKRYDDPPDPVPLESLPGYILTRQQGNFDLIFSALSDPQLANHAWELIVKLPTNPQILKQVQDLEASWSDILDKNSYHKLLYVLQIIESIMEGSIEEESEKAKNEWKLKFLEVGGFEQLYEYLLNFEYTEDIFQKTCVEFLLKLICLFILAAFSALSPDIYEVVELVRKNSGGQEEEVVKLEEEPIEAETKPEKDELISKSQTTKGFKQLVQDILMLDLADNLLSKVNFDALVHKLIGLMSIVLQRADYEPEDKHIIDSALELFVSCVMHKNELIETVYSYNEGITNKEFTTKGLTSPKTILYRKAFHQSLKGICKSVTNVPHPPTAYYLQMLIECMPAEMTDTKVAEYSQYFDLLCDLVELDTRNPTLNYEAFAQEIMTKIRLHPYTEKRNTFYADRVLVGLLNIAERVFRCLPDLKNLPEVVEFTYFAFVDLLFPPAAEVENLHYDPNFAYEVSHFQPPKAKARETRTTACKLITTLVDGQQENLKVILPVLESIQSQTIVVRSWNYLPSMDMRSVHGYAGITNLGCICYMNAMLQQFYMIPQFRYSILDVDDGIEPTNLLYLQGDPSIDRTETGVDVDDNLLHQLQHLFGYLELTDRQSYNPSHFCYAFKDFSGNPTNISIQQDTQEFLNMIFDRLEQSLKPTSYNSLISGVFGGQTSNQLICKECNTIKEHYEDFYNISVDVKHSKTLFESFDKFIAGDTISDFQCDTCEKRVEITKRTLLANLPNILIVHLQRIVFSFDTLANEKINTRLEFPPALNVYPYTKLATQKTEEEEAPDESDYLYDLVGIIVHTGTAEVGHYYSFIKDPGSVKWYEFNDSVVRSFNISNLETECFGGHETLVDEPVASWFKSNKDSSRNAYMLIYEKRLKRELVLEGDGTAFPRKKPFEEVEKAMPGFVYRSVLRDNEKYMFERNLYSSEFFNFMSDVLKSSLNADIDMSIPGSAFTIDIVAHASQNRMLPDLVKTLLALFENFPSSCEQFMGNLIHENIQVLCSTLLVCTEKNTRNALRELYSGAVKLLSQSSFEESTLAKGFIEVLLSFMPQETNKNWSRFQHYWELYRDFAETSKEHSLFLLEKGVIGLFLDYYLADKSPLLKPGETRNALGNKLWNPIYDGLIETISELNQYCSTSRRSGEFQLSEDDMKCLLCKEFYDKTLRNGYDCDALGKIVSHWAWEDLEYSQMIAQIILKGINEIDYEEVKGYYTILQHYFTIDDSLTSHRIEWIMGFPSPISSKKVDMNDMSFGNAMISAIDEEVTTYMTTLSFGYSIYDSAETVLSLIWKHRKRYDICCIINIKNLLEIINKNEELGNYIDGLPAPTYQYSSYCDWIEDYLESNRLRASTYTHSYPSSMLSNDKKEEHGAESQSLYDSFRANRPKKTLPQYIIGKTLGLTVVRKEEKEDVQLTVYEYTTKWAPSEPEAKHNKTLPSKLLRTEMISKAYYPSRPVNLTVEGHKYPQSAKTTPDGSGDQEMVTYSSNATPAVIIEEYAEEYRDEKDDEEDFEEASTLLVFEVFNAQTEPKRIEIKFENSENGNFRHPTTTVMAELASRAAKNMITIYKIDPLLGWGQVDFHWNVIDSQPFSLKGDFDEYMKESSINAFYQASDVHVNTSEICSIDDDVKPEPGMKKCSQCTLLNDENARFCQVCNLSFPTNN